MGLESNMKEKHPQVFAWFKNSVANPVTDFYFLTKSRLGDTQCYTIYKF